MQQRQIKPRAVGLCLHERSPACRRRRSRPAPSSAASGLDLARSWPASSPPARRQAPPGPASAASGDDRPPACPRSPRASGRCRGSPRAGHRRVHRRVGLTDHDRHAQSAPPLRPAPTPRRRAWRPAAPAAPSRRGLPSTSTAATAGRISTLMSARRTTRGEHDHRPMVADPADQVQVAPSSTTASGGSVADHQAHRPDVHPIPASPRSTAFVSPAALHPRALPPRARSPRPRSELRPRQPFLGAPRSARQGGHQPPPGRWRAVDESPMSRPGGGSAWPRGWAIIMARSAPPRRSHVAARGARRATAGAGTPSTALRRLPAAPSAMMMRFVANFGAAAVSMIPRIHPLPFG